MTKLKAAVIGCGRIGSTIDDEIGPWQSVALPYSHAARYAESPFTDLVAGCDADPAKAETFRERWGTERAFTDIHEMMEVCRPDIVSVATQTATRVEAALAACEHNPKALFIDKPISVTLREADQLLDVCRAKGIIVQVNCSRVWDPGAVQSMEILKQGIIGDLRCVVGFCPGGISHMGSHMITFMGFFAGNAEWVVGQAAEPPEDQPDRDLPGLAMIQYDTGVHGYLNMLDPGPVGVELDLIGTIGRIRSLSGEAEWELSLPGALESKRKLLARQPFPMPHRVVGFGLRSIQELCNSIETGAKPFCDGNDGRHALEIALALRDSHRRGNVRVDMPFTDLDAAIPTA